MAAQKQAEQLHEQEEKRRAQQEEHAEFLRRMDEEQQTHLSDFVREPRACSRSCS